MAYRKKHISTKDKPYKCVGWGPGPNSLLVPKFAPKTEKELAKMETLVRKFR